MKEFIIKKYSNLPQKKIFKISTDVKNFHDVMPHYFKSLYVINETQNEKIVLEKIFFFGLAALLVLSWFLYSKVLKKENPQSQYEFVKVERRTLENVISGTGTLNPLSTVEVGTRVSGTIDKIYVDFNDVVTKGQILAVLDTTLLASSVRESHSKVEQASIQYEQAKLDFNRNKELFKKGFLEQSEYEALGNDVKLKKIALDLAENNLTNAKSNLGYAIIKSPIDGIVIQKNVEVGQTVAASLSAPTLFLIAEDLSQMEILGLVDESDIGMIKQGQDVKFTVEAYFDQIFTGKVSQVRLNPETISNVVTYTVVINTDNSENILYPGMTATIDFITEKKEDILVIPNKALSFKPSDEVMQKFFEERRKKFQEKQSQSESSSQEKRSFDKKTSRNDIARLWYLNENNELSLIAVKKGFTDGSYTEIEMLRRNKDSGIDIKEGLEIISSISVTDNSEKKSSRNIMGNTRIRRF